MKKLLLLVALIATTTLGAYAQTEKGEKSVVLGVGFQSDPMRFLVGGQGRYNITDNIRIAPDVMFIFPKDKVMGLDINVNAHYVFNLDQSLSVYPLAGLSMMNGRYSGQTINNVKIPSASSTNWGFNLGGGVGYNLSSTNFVNAEMKYTFSDGDGFTMFLGYGFKF